MIKTIALERPVPIAQQGEVVAFQRRTADQSDLRNLDSLEKIYDHIRMLDAEGYPHAFLETEHFTFEFTKAEQDDSEVKAEVCIKRRS